MSIYSRVMHAKKTPQSERASKRQKKNSAGGYAFAVDCWQRLDRFLILGNEGGSYYASERAMTRANAQAVERCIAADGARTVARIVEISDAGRAPKNEPAIFALAMCAKLGDDATRALARAAFPKVCRIGTHLFHLVEALEAFGGWGRGTRRAIGAWYEERPAEQVAHQVVKYQSRNGWSHRDVLRLAHPKAADAEKNAIYKWVTEGAVPDVMPADAMRLPWAFEQAKKAGSKKEIVSLIVDHGLPRECVPTEWLKEPEVWAALLVAMPLGAMLRNLATMTRVGLVTNGSAHAKKVADAITDRRGLARARVHPIAVLSAMLTYAAGRGARGQHTWTPVTKVVDALDRAFYASFANVLPTGKRWMLALDVSGSMGCGVVAGVPGLSPRIASAALALITAASEPAHTVFGFTTGLSPLDVSPRMRLDDVVRRISGLPFGGTDCAQPMIHAEKAKMDVDVFVVLTDNETWAGGVHPHQALASYRGRRGIPAKLITVGMVSNGFSIADPDDAGMLDVVGFDTSCPALMADFARA